MPSPPPTGFNPAAKVICINDRFPPESFPHFLSLPRRNQIYTVTRLMAGQHWHTKEPTWHLVLDECPKHPSSCFRDLGFLLDRFLTLSDFTACLALKSSKTTRKRQTAPLP